MNRIAAALETARTRPLIIPFVTAGFPTFDATPGVCRALARAGADMIEIGMPFSDPLADGPTIQASSERALANGMTVRGTLAAVRELRADSLLAGVPLILMGYVNPLLRYGLEQFVADAAAAGIDGLIVPDLLPDEAQDYRRLCADAGVGVTFLMAPNTPDERVRMVDAASSHFSYCVSITGVTGARGNPGSDPIAYLDRVSRLVHKPFVIGFGVKTPEQVRELGAHAAGVVVGSALIDRMAAAPDPVAAAAEMLHELRIAADSVVRARPDQ